MSGTTRHARGRGPRCRRSRRSSIRTVASSTGSWWSPSARWTPTTCSRRPSSPRFVLSPLNDGSRLDRWVLTIASRKALDHHRARGRRAIPVEHVPEIATTTPPEWTDPLWAAVQDLPPRQRLAVVHRHVLDRSYREIAELMDCSEETARANAYQGTKRLRELMT